MVQFFETLLVSLAEEVELDSRPERHEQERDSDTADEWSDMITSSGLEVVLRADAILARFGRRGLVVVLRLHVVGPHVHRLVVWGWHRLAHRFGGRGLVMVRGLDFLYFMLAHAFTAFVGDELDDDSDGEGGEDVEEDFLSSDDKVGEDEVVDEEACEVGDDPYEALCDGVPAVGRGEASLDVVEFDEWADRDHDEPDRGIYDKLLVVVRGVEYRGDFSIKFREVWHKQ